MLRNLQVRDFAIVDRIDVEFRPGMTVLTGETGAGKSILVDALGLVLGERGSASALRPGAQRAEFSAEFDLSALPACRDWLAGQALEDGDNCLVRRVIGSDGRSRAWINGNAVTLQQLKELGEQLVDIHGQHFHQSLGRRPVQRALLDHFGSLTDLRQETGQAWRDWRLVHDRLEDLRGNEAGRAARIDLLAFQLQELEALALAPGEHEALAAERQRLLNGSKLADGVAAALRALFDDETGNANRLVAEATRAIDPLLACDPGLAPVAGLLDGAAIQIVEAAEVLQRYADDIDLDPAHRDAVEERLAAAQALARKHRIAADELPSLQSRLTAELADLENSSTTAGTLEAERDRARAAYDGLAKKLSAGRRKAARSLSKRVTEAMHGLGMPGGRFEIVLGTLAADEARPHGVDDIGFEISANPGQPLQALSKVVSGGELSRMSLAIQVIASGGSLIPTMVFDEVDSGVGGGVAEMVGRRLAELGLSRQVLCVTHLPQVASQAGSHLRIAKVSDGRSTRTRVDELDGAERVAELARMLGGVEITEKTLAHAAEMLASAPEKRA